MKLHRQLNGKQCSTAKGLGRGLGRAPVVPHVIPGVQGANGGQLFNGRTLVNAAAPLVEAEDAALVQHVPVLEAEEVTDMPGISHGSTPEFEVTATTSFDQAGTPIVDVKVTLLENKNKLLAAAKNEEKARTFSWTSMWWPVAALDSLNPKIPMKVDLLGKTMVVWADSKGNWHCQEDRCPHRLAPLSEGRVEGDNLMCSYHGWEFNGEGKCVKIPQIPKDSAAHETACSSGRSCVATYPVTQSKGLLWVWPESGQRAEVMAASTSVTDVASEGMGAWFVRDLPIRYDTLVENIVDPSHVPFSHHGIQGNRYKAPTMNDMELSDVSYLGFMTTRKSQDNKESHMIFNAPSQVYYEFQDTIFLQSIVVPTKPGWSRLYANFPAAPPPFIPAAARAVVNLKKKLGEGFEHATSRNAVLDGDTYFLHLSERKMAPSEGLGINSAIKKYYMPSEADAGIRGFRQWLQEFAGQVPTCTPADEPFIPLIMEKEQVLDRYNQHTKNCSHCLKTLARVDTALKVSKTLGLISAVAFMAQAISVAALMGLASKQAAAAAVPTAVASVASGLAGMDWTQACSAAGVTMPLIVTAVVALVCWLIQKPLQNFRQKFFYEEYVHAKRD